MDIESIAGKYLARIQCDSRFYLGRKGFYNCGNELASRPALWLDSRHDRDHCLALLPTLCSIYVGGWYFQGIAIVWGSESSKKYNVLTQVS